MLTTVSLCPIFYYMTRQDYYNLTQMKERGWTTSIIKKLVDIQPTEFKGMYSKQPQKCYPKDYVESLELTERFNELKKAASVRHTRMKAIADGKRDENVTKYSERVDAVKVPVLSAEELKSRTIKSKRRWYSYQAAIRCDIDEGIDEDNLPNTVLFRWEVNYIRHELTKYDKILSSIGGLVGTHDVYRTIRGRILDKISEVYPWLRDECNNQKTAE